MLPACTQEPLIWNTGCLVANVDTAVEYDNSEKACLPFTVLEMVTDVPPAFL